MLWECIQALAAQQRWLVTRPQILNAGGSDAWIQWAMRDGRLRRVRHGVYAMLGATSEHQALMAACLGAGPGAAASHLAAAALWGAQQVKPGRIEIAIFDGRHSRQRGVIVHRSRLDAATAITKRFDIPIVIPPLTVVQLAETCTPYLVKQVANDLVKRNWTTFRAILAWIDTVGDRRQQALRELCLQAVDLGGHDNSPAARVLGQKLKAAGVPPFEMDYPVQTADGMLFIDFAWPEPKVGLEYNGSADHDGLLSRGDDARRRLRLGALGWRIFDVNSAIPHAEVIKWVRAALAVVA